MTRSRVALLCGSALAGLITLAAGAGCGGAASPYREGPATVEPEREDPAELESEQVELEDRLGAVLARPEPDCDRACELGGAICDLSERICAIAERHPDDAETQGRCTDASGRCDLARERIAESCTCEAP